MDLVWKENTIQHLRTGQPRHSSHLGLVCSPSHIPKRAPRPHGSIREFSSNSECAPRRGESSFSVQNMHRAEPPTHLHESGTVSLIRLFLAGASLTWQQSGTVWWWWWWFATDLCHLVTPLLGMRQTGPGMRQSSPVSILPAVLPAGAGGHRQ